MQLGANETGILNPLTIEQAKKQVATGGLRGATIKSDTRAAKDAADRALYGVESRFVLLRNVCGPDEVDDDLPTEIGDEARKVGIPERVKVVVAPPYKSDVEPIDRVRIFITYTGLVGAYEAVRLFNGRVFNGRTVRAQYFDEAWAERQLWAMPVDP